MKKTADQNYQIRNRWLPIILISIIIAEFEAGIKAGIIP